MSSTNKTANLQLSQFVATDIPSILTDYNGDMRKIDAGVQEAKTAVAGAVSDLSSVTARVGNVESDVTGLNSAVQGVASRVSAVEGDVTEIRSEVSGVADDVKGIADVVPSTASESNQLATMADIPSISGTRVRMVQKQTFNFNNFNSFTEILNAISTYITQNFGSGHDLSPVIFANYPSGYPMVYRVNKAQPFYFEGFCRIEQGLAWGTIDLASGTKWNVDYTTTYNDGLALNKIDVTSTSYPTSGSISIYGYELY